MKRCNNKIKQPMKKGMKNLSTDHQTLNGLGPIIGNFVGLYRANNACNVTL